MEKYGIVVWSSDSIEGLEKLVRDHINEQYDRIINVSHSSCWNPQENKMVFSVAVAYSYVKTPDMDGPPEHHYDYK